MNLLIDANLPYSLRTALKRFGTVMHVRDFGLMAAHDDAVLSAAIQRKAVLLTRDLDFGHPFQYPPAKHQGVIILRVPAWYRVVDIASYFVDHSLSLIMTLHTLL